MLWLASVRLSAHPNVTYRPAPRLGEHTHAILGNLLDLEAEALHDLEADGVI